MKIFSVIATFFLLIACAHMMPEGEKASLEKLPIGEVPLEKDQQFNSYWYAGMAELTSYTLSQARYGELHEGESVLVYVTEDFLKDTQVKRESDTKEEALSVMKLNRIDRFTTGIYDYSMMLSVFTPVEQTSHPYTLKTSFSSQDWCGHSWMQLNRKNEAYEASVRSYFEAEGDRQEQLKDQILEDEIWTLARLDPKALPVGEVTLLPSSSHIRLNHVGLSSEKAKATLMLEVDDKSSERFVYTLDYESGRKLVIYIQTAFPHRIYGWEEKVKSGWGPAAKWLTTTATMKGTIKSAYWGKKSVADSDLRKQLKLD
jgi:hypothetical protein